MEIRRSILNAAQRERFDGSIGGHHHSVDRSLFVKTVGLQIVHRVVGVVRRLMAGRTLALAEEYFLAMHLCQGSLCRVKLPIPSQLRSWREIQDFLKFRHKVNLASPF